MLTKTFILDTINHNESFDSTNLNTTTTKITK